MTRCLFSGTRYALMIPSWILIDLICVASFMLLRIRWTPLEADYSVALQLMLQMPAPSASWTPHIR